VPFTEIIAFCYENYTVSEITLFAKCGVSECELKTIKIKVKLSLFRP
jgi:hypothetical protein